MSLVFTKKTLEKYSVVNSPGVAIVIVSKDITDKDLVLDEYPRYIVPIRVIKQGSLNKILSIIDKNNGSASFKDILPYTLTGALWLDRLGNNSLPVKGEQIVATFDYINYNNSTQLLCTNLSLYPRMKLDPVEINKDLIKSFNQNLSKMFENLET